MNVSAPSVTKMLQRLDESRYLEYEKYHGINLTAKGNQIADLMEFVKNMEYYWNFLKF